jgi:hypothetical protein
MPFRRGPVGEATMAVKKLFQGLTGRSGYSEPSADYGSVPVISPRDGARRLELLDDFETAGLGWMWASDPEGG